MEPGQEPTTEAERADLDAIEALRESSVLELKVNSPLFTADTVL